MRLLVAPALLVGMMGCTGADDQAIIGIWTYDSFTRDGETIAVEVGVNAAIAPFVEFGESMRGVAGCNGFEQFEGSFFRLEDRELRTGEVIFEAAGCAPDALMESELAFQGAVWQDSTISVSIDGDHMTWHRVEIVDEVDHQAYGYDAENEIVVVVQFDDMAPETFSIYTCP